MEKKENGEKVTVRPETKLSIIALAFFVLASFTILAALDLAGVAGKFFFNNFKWLFGFGYLFLPTLFILLGLSFLRGQEPKLIWPHLLGGIIFLLSGLGILGIYSAGGVIGRLVAWPFLALFGIYMSLLLLLAILIVSLLLIFQKRLTFAPLLRFFKKIINFLKNFFTREAEENPTINLAVKSLDAEESEAEELSEPEETKEKKKEKKEKKLAKKEVFEAEEVFPVIPRRGKYTPPPLSLLGSDRGEAKVGDIKANMNIIKRTLESFGISVEMDEVTIGPTVTRYALKPAEGVKLSRIVSLQNDLALALAAHPLRIEAPIPGKALVGIEIPNKKKSLVGLADLLSEEEFKKEKRPLLVPLGRGLSGKGIYESLTKMPHLLIGGTTGSGKSVLIHTIITSLLYRHSPEELRFILIDPKRVELTFYNKIPHLLTPVITEPKKAILALRFAAKEMESRYQTLEEVGVRDITSYQKMMSEKKVPDTIFRPMPYIVIVIDELADIMSTYPRELEAAIVRLAQMSRAVGIHLILSTQRPSVNVITGLIKANIPTRVALQVSSQVDSRTILDMAGAEKLLGSGDMLYLGSNKNQPERLQSAFISEEEVKKVVKFLVEHNESEEELFSFAETETDSVLNNFSANLEESLDSDDELFEEAKRIVLEAGKASTSYLQRRLKIGYSRAARLMDILEEKGIIGPPDGSKPREVIKKGT